MNPDTSADWRPRQVIAALDAKGWTCRRLAEYHGVAYTTITDALRSPYPVSEKRIAHALGIHPSTIWPSRYHPDGTSKAKLRGPRNRSANRKFTDKRGTVKANKSQTAGRKPDNRPDPAHELTSTKAAG